MGIYSDSSSTKSAASEETEAKPSPSFLEISKKIVLEKKDLLSFQLSFYAAELWRKFRGTSI